MNDRIEKYKEKSAIDWGYKSYKEAKSKCPKDYRFPMLSHAMEMMHNDWKNLFNELLNEYEEVSECHLIDRGEDKDFEKLENEIEEWKRKAGL